MAYSIDLPQFQSARQLIETRKAFLKQTSILWVPIKWEFAPEMIGMIYISNRAILIWLN